MTCRRRCDRAARAARCPARASAKRCDWRCTRSMRRPEAIFCCFRTATIPAATTNGSKTQMNSEATLPVLQPRYGWFLGPALLLLALTLLGRERARARPDNALPANAPKYLAVLRLVFVPFLMTLVSAAPRPGVERLLRDG